MLLDLLCTKGGIIQASAGAYNRCTVRNRLCCNDDSEFSGSFSLRTQAKDAGCRDTLSRYCTQEQVSNISYHSSDRLEMLALAGVPDEPVDVAVDFHDIGYYGGKKR